MSAIDQFFTARSQLPVMPELARQLMASFDDEAVDLPMVVSIVASYPALAARLLRLAQAPRYAAARPAATLDDAALCLGIDALRQLALSAAIVEVFPPVPGIDPVAFWRHGFATAGYARWLGGLLGLDADNAQLAGFLLRAGQLLMARSMAPLVQEVEAGCSAPGLRFEREQRLIGCSHAQVTAELARRWNLPPRLVRAFHDAADPLAAVPLSPTAATLHLAATLADAGELGLEPVPALRRARPHLLERLQLDTAWMQALAPRHADLTAAAAPLLA